MPRPRRRDHLLAVAGERFYRSGINATGIDALIAEAGVAKMTLYSNFGSKDRLVVAYLEQRDRAFFTRLDEKTAGRRDPVRRALSVVDVYADYLDEEGFRGCAFVNAAAELPSGHPAREVVTRHKAAVIERWSELIAATGADRPRDVAQDCAFVLEGAFALAGVGVVTDRLAGARSLIEERLTAQG